MPRSVGAQSASVVGRIAARRVGIRRADARECSGLLELFLEAQVLHAASVATHEFQRLAADADVRLDEVRRDHAVARS